MKYLKINNNIFIKLKKTKYIRKLPDGKGGFKYIYKEEKKINKKIDKNKENLKQIYEEINKLKKDEKYKNYSLGIRFTNTPEDDIKREWSAWMGTWSKTMEDVINNTPYASDLDDDWEKWQDEDYSSYHSRNHDDYDEFLEDFAEKNDLDIRQDKKTGKYAEVHHEGLSIYAHKDNNIEGIESIKEVKDFSNNIGDSFKGGEGDQTIGEVKLLGKLGESKYLFAIENHEKEMV